MLPLSALTLADYTIELDPSHLRDIERAVRRI
jgi:hypothetical protein